MAAKIDHLLVIAVLKSSFAFAARPDPRVPSRRA